MPSPDALAATVADLAARGFLHVEQVAGAHCYRVEADADCAELLPYERMVRALFRPGVRGELVPFDQLTLGVEDEVDIWWTSFAAAVTEVACARGYVSRWWARAAVLAIVALAVAAVVLMMYAHWNPTNDAAQVAALVAFAAVGCGAYASDSLEQWASLSRRGRRRARDWARVAHELGDADGFESVRIGGVVVWGPVLAYAVALGLAPRAVADVPVRPDGPRSTWLLRGGSWTRVDIRYPRRVPPGWGRRPWLVALVGLVTAGLAGLVLVAAARAGSWHPSPPFSDGIADVLGDLEPAIAAVAATALAFGGWAFALGVIDLVRRTKPLSGVVVARRVDVTNVGPWTDFVPRSRWLAVDDGRSRRLRAYRVGIALFERVSVGDDADGSISPMLGYLSMRCRKP